MPTPNLTANDIRDIADRILAEHQPDGGIPIQIEEIIEFGLEMEIRPIRALKARLNFEGALTFDLQTILIDEDMMQHQLHQYHLTLAHELGHKLLHEDFIISLELEDQDGWKKAVAEIDPIVYGKLEDQALIFAGYLLVPTLPLYASCEEARYLANQHGIDLSVMGYNAISYISGSIAKDYQVPTMLVHHRIMTEGIFKYPE
ncbi:MAG: ImmA/IrrE family metallo-endopeptidase [Armatimonadota bacterium]